MKFRLGKKVWSILLSVVMVASAISPSFAVEENVVNTESEVLVEEKQPVENLEVKEDINKNLAEADLNKELSDLVKDELITETKTNNLEATNSDTNTVTTVTAIENTEKNTILKEVLQPLQAEAPKLEETAIPYFDIMTSKVLMGTKITLSAPNKDKEAKVYYTIDEVLKYPENTVEYTEPIEINRAMTISAIAIADGKNPSKIKSIKYGIANVFGSVDAPLSVDEVILKATANDIETNDLIVIKGKISRIFSVKDSKGKSTTFTAIGIEGGGEISFQEKCSKSKGLIEDIKAMQIGEEYIISAAYYKGGKEHQFVFDSISQIKKLVDGVVVKDPDLVLIHQIQGDKAVSKYENQLVMIEGIVTASYKDNYGSYMYVQEEDTDKDADLNTSEGIFINDAPIVEVGKKIKLVGTVEEYKEEIVTTDKSTGNKNILYGESLKTTRLKFKSIVSQSNEKSPLPETVKISAANPIPEHTFMPKGKDVEDITRELDIKNNAIDFYESIEGMRVEIELPKVVGFAEKYGNVFVVPSQGTGYDLVTPSGGIKAVEDHHRANVITLDFSMKPITNKDKVFNAGYTFNTGDQYKGNITGFVKYQFGDYKIVCDGNQELPEKTGSGMERAVTTLTSAPDKLTVASYNIENFTGNAPQEKVDNVAASIVDNLKTPDIIGLVEVQDNDGEGGNSSEANKSYERVIAAIKEKSGITYAYTQIDPVHGKDGGAPGSNIRVGYLYNPLRVKLGAADAGAGNSTTEAKMVQKDGKWMLANNPARLGTASSAFIETRKSLVACFNFRGEDVYIVANHFSSKRGETGPFGYVQPPAVNPEDRIAQAKVVNDFIEKEILANKTDAKVIVLGDMNDFEYSPTLKALEGSKLFNMHYSLDENKRYTYIHSGLSQTLDHILVTKDMNDSKSVEFEPVHMNAEFTVASGRASDHDALMARFSGIGSGEVNLLAPPTASLASGEVAKGTSITVESAADTVVYYTVDGKTPNKDSLNSKTNAVEITIDKDITVKAIAISGDKESAVMTWTYTLPMAKSTIAEARKVNKGTAVYVEGIAQSTPGAFGDSGFYIVDDTETIFIYPAQGADTSDIKLGTLVRVKGIMDNYKGLIQVKPTYLEAISQGNKVTAVEVKINELDKHRDNLVKVNEAEVKKVETDKYNNTIVELKKGEVVFKVKLDARSGFGFVEGKYKVGMKLDVTGFVKDAKNIAVRSFDDMAIVGATPETKIALSNLELKDLNGKVIKTVKENGFVMISVMAKNDAAVKDTVGTLIFKIEKDNKPVRMGIIGTAMANDGVYSLGFDTKAMPKGKYEVKVYYWNTLVGQKPVAEPVTLTFDIE